MAVTTTVDCDRCGERVASDRTNLRPTCGPMRRREPIDLCDACRRALEEWLAAGAGVGRSG